jgi:hypothetical protein
MKQDLYGDTVLRRDGDQLYLMNRQEGGWREWAVPVESEAYVLSKWNVRLGEWSRDEHGEFCPVTRIPRSEQPTLHDGEEAHQVELRELATSSESEGLPAVQSELD